ncbi:glycerophosphodiester phosphodiesterase [Vallitalea okinawensis]|uniref:glycerophosphodiester phosphodiesterase n=1 Tax=Vallitalea okinawensis TaxID=2078660 RepID=UPI000CFBC7D3|nr:glycerophosphodiester phosphodiesterase [Vallitalea okinawensis]
MIQKHSIIQEYRMLLKEFFIGLKPFLIYQLFTAALIYILILPSFQLLLTSVMKSSPYQVLTNGVITKYLLSPQGFLTILLAMVLSIIVLLIEIGGLIVISNQIYTRHAPPTFKSIMVYCLSNIKKLISIGGLFIILYFFVMMPFINIAFRTSLVSNFSLPSFILDYVNQVPVLDLLLTFISIVLIFLSIHWIFALHITIIKDISARSAIRESYRLVKHHYFNFFKYSLGILLVNIIVIFISSIVSLLPIFLIEEWVNLSTLSGTIIVSILMTIYLLILFIISTFVFPINVHLITRLYYQLSGEPKHHLRLGSSQARWLTSMKKRTFNWLLFLTFFIATLITIVMVEDIKNTKYDVDITAHRGASVQAPENTLAALQSAIDQGADYAEIDVQLTKDGHAILLHDKKLSRTTGVDQKPSDLTLKEIKTLDAGSWFSSEYHGEPIPTLEEAILFSKDRLKLNIELKGGYNDEQLVNEVIRLIKEYHFNYQAVVTSLDYNLIEAIEDSAPYITTGYVMYMAFGDLSTLNTDFYSMEASTITEQFVYNAHILGRDVHAWTVNDIDLVTELVDDGVDNIITDDIRLIKNHITYLNSEMSFERILENLLEIIE